MEYLQAHKIASEVLAQLEPFCYRAEIGGSIRRKKPEVKDIEVVAIPKPYDNDGFFVSGLAEVVNKWEKVKGELEYGVCKYTQRILPEGIKLDLFFADEENWGNIFQLRTGSSEFNFKILNALKNYGLKSEGGYIKRGDKLVPVYDEHQYFLMLGMDYIEPEMRH